MSINNMLDCTNDVAQLSASLFDNMGLNYFNYACFFKTKKAIFLSNNSKFMSEIYNKKCGFSFDYLNSLVSSNQLLHHGNYYFLSVDNKQYDNRQLANSCGISDIVFMIVKLDDSFLLFSYGSHDKNHATKTILQRPDALIKYKSQFLGQYQRKINALEPITIVNTKSIITEREKNNMAYNPDKFKASMNPRHYFVIHNGKQLKITAREKEALQHLARAKTGKEIAQAMGIQPITVILYLKNLREKLGVTTKRELLRFYYNSDLCIMDAEYFTPNRKK